MVDLKLGDLRHRRHEIVGERAGQDVAGVIIDDRLVKGVGDALGNAAMDLALDDRGLIRRPASSTMTKRSMATCPVAMSTVDDRDMAGIGEGAARVVGRHRRQPGLGDRREAVALKVGGARHLADPDTEIGAANDGAALS